MGKPVKLCASSKLVIFDLDGTLVDSRSDIVTALNRALRSVGGTARKEQEIIGLVGRPLVEIIEILLPDRLRSLAGQAASVYRSCYFDRDTYSSRLYPGVIECLDALAGCRLAIATTKPTGTARRVLQGLGLGQRFDLVQGSEDLPSKPDPAVLHRVLECLGTRAQDGWMVGDTVHDIQAGRRAGLHTCAVTGGFGPSDELAAAGPDLLIDNLARLPAFL